MTSVPDEELKVSDHAVEESPRRPIWRTRLSRVLVEPTHGGVGRPERWAAVVFLALAVPIGLAYIFLIPPSQVIDERSHFVRTWQLAEFNLRSDQQFDPASGVVRNGAVFDVCVIEYIDGFGQQAAEPRDFTTRSFWFDTPDCSPRTREFVVTDASLSYGPWSYPGHVVGVALGRVLGLALPVTFYLGRIVGLFVYIGAVAAALRIAPRARLGLFVVGLLPMSMMAAAAYSTDGVMVGGAILATACVLRLALRPVTPARFLFPVLATSLFLVVATKPNYAVLLALLALVPAGSFGSKRRGRLVLLGTAVGIVVASGLLQRLLQGAPIGEITYPGTDPAYQLRSLLSHPFGFLRTVWRTFFSYTSEVFFLRGWVGIFGMFRTGRPEVAPLLAVPYVILAFCTLAVAVVAEGGAARALQRSAYALRLGVGLLVVLAGVFGVYAVGFVFWTQPDAATIEGVQSRYLLPYAPMLGGAIALVRHRSDVFVSLRGISVAMVVLAAASFHQIGSLFY